MTLNAYAEPWVSQYWMSYICVTIKSIMLNVVTLTVIMLNVVAHYYTPNHSNDLTYRKVSKFTPKLVDFLELL